LDILAGGCVRQKPRAVNAVLVTHQKIEKNKTFFFEKKNQKTFAPCGPGDVETSRVKVAKVFCGAPGGEPFFQKSDRLPLESSSFA
jgi:hypothetical protein